jgi:hypothetical protein
MKDTSRLCRSAMRVFLSHNPAVELMVTAMRPNVLTEPKPHARLFKKTLLKLRSHALGPQHQKGDCCVLRVADAKDKKWEVLTFKPLQTQL